MSETPMKRYIYQPLATAPLNPAVLHVFGAGLAIDQVPTHAIWREMHAAGNIRPAAPTPAVSLAERRDDADLFRAAALRGALRHWPSDGSRQMEFPEGYPIPTVIALPRWRHPPNQKEDWISKYRQRLLRTLDVGVPMPFHQLNIVSQHEDETTPPDWDQLFRRFDEAGDLNSLLLWGEDGYSVRSETGGWENGENESLANIVTRGRRPTDLAESFAAVLLARPDAAQWLAELAPHVRDTSTVRKFQNGRQGRTAHGFKSIDPDVHYGVDNTGKSTRPYRVTAYVPQPWAPAQVAQYQAMPTLAKLHRPQMAIYADAGQPPASAPSAQRGARLASALEAAVKGPLGGTPPRRIFYDLSPGAPGTAQQLLLMRCLLNVLPDFNFFDPDRAVDLTRRIGDTGAAAGFAGVALASHAAWETGGSALVVHLRREDCATVLALEPMDAAYRATFARRPYDLGE
jgi:hypothetical protein